MKTLMYLTLNGKNKEEELQAKALTKYFEDFSTVILIVVGGLLLGTINVISKQLQSAEENLEHAVKMILSLIDQISNLRNDWSAIKIEAVFLCNKWKIPINFLKKGKIDEVVVAHK